MKTAQQLKEETAMESNIRRVPLRLNLDNPEHREIWELMESLKPEFHTSKTRFILDAIRCYLEYVRHTDDPAFVQKFYSKDEFRKLATKGDIHTAIDDYDKKLKNWLLDLITVKQPGRTTLVNPNYASQLSESYQEDKQWPSPKY